MSWTRPTTFARLTWFNTVRLFLSPLAVPGTALGAGLILGTGWTGGLYTMENWYSGVDTLALAVGSVMFAVVAFPAMREARYSAALVASLGRNGRLLSLMAASVLVTTVFMAALAWLCYRLSASPLPGTLSPTAYPAPFLLAAAGPLLSVALVAWTRSYLPLVVSALAVPAYWLYGIVLSGTGPQNAVSQMEWAVRVTMHPFNVRAPSVTEVAALYLVYAVLVVALLVFLALAARGRRTLRAVCLGTVTLLLAGAVGTVAHGRGAHSMETPVPDSKVYGAHGPSCQTRERVTYCPLPGFEPWVDHWQEALAPAMALLPEVPEDRMPVVWQASSSYRRDLEVPPDRDVVVYGRMGMDRDYWRSDLVSRVSRVALDLPSPYEQHRCQATGQARMVLSAWLSGTGKGLSHYEELDFIAMHLFPYRPSPVDLEVSRELAGIPEERVSRVLAQNWERLSAPRGSTLDLAELLGLRLQETSTGPALSEDWDRLYPELGYGESMVDMSSQDSVCA